MRLRKGADESAISSSERAVYTPSAPAHAVTERPEDTGHMFHNIAATDTPSIGAESENAREENENNGHIAVKLRQATGPSRPFQLQHKVLDSTGGTIDAPTTFLDEGAGVNVVDEAWVRMNADRLPPITKAPITLRLADGSARQASGKLSLNLLITSMGVSFKVPTDFVVMPTADVWGMLLGKPWKTALGVIHDYRSDAMFFSDGAKWVPVLSKTTEPTTKVHGFPLHTIDQDLGQCVPPLKPPIATVNADHGQAVLGLVSFGADLSPEETTIVRETVLEFADVFATSTQDVQPIKGFVHKFAIRDNARFPLRSRQPPMTAPEQAAACEQADRLLSAGILEYAPAGDVKCVSGTIMVPKRAATGTIEIEELLEKLKGGELDGVPAKGRDEISRGRPTPEYRMVHNFKPLNDGCDSPIWVAEDLNLSIAKQAGRRYTTVLDQLSAFFAVELAPESRPYATVYIPGRGHMRYKRLPQGCAGSPATQQAVLMKVLSDLVTSGRVTYWMDDVCFASDSFQDHLCLLKDVLSRARAFNVRFSPKKSKLFQSSVIVGGHLIGAAGRRPDPELVSAIWNWDNFGTAMDILRFANTASYFRDMVPDMALISRPLYDAVRVRAPISRRRGAVRSALRETVITLLPEQKKAIDTIKNKLASMPVLMAPLYKEDVPFYLAVDACKDGFGLHLYQLFNGLRSVMFASRRTTDAEARRHSSINELASIKWALEKTRTIVAGHPLVVETDCRAVRGLLSNSKLAASTARWQEQIAAYTNVSEFRHRPGKGNVVADALSRAKIGPEPTDDEQGDSAALMLLAVDQKTAELLHRFRSDPLYAMVCHLTGVVRSKCDTVMRKSDEFFVIDGMLFFRHKDSGKALKVLTAEEGRHRARSMHEATGHLSRDLTRNAVIDQGQFWPRMVRDINYAIETCKQCQSVGPAFMNFQLRSSRRYRPFQSVAMDYAVLPTSEAEDRHILVFIDLATKFVIAYPQPEDPSSASTIRGLIKLGRTYILPEEVVCDDHSVLRSEVVKAWLKGESEIVPKPSKEIKLAISTPYGHVAVAESAIHQVLLRLRKAYDVDISLLDPHQARRIYNDSVPWSSLLEEAVSLHNDRKRTDLGGLSPRQLLLGSLDGMQVTVGARGSGSQNQPRQDRFDVLFDALEAYDAAKDWESKPSAKRPSPFIPGDIVAVYNPRYDETKSAKRKLMRKWIAPLVVDSVARASATVKHLDGTLFATVKMNRLRHWDGVLAHADKGPTLQQEGRVDSNDV